MIEERQPYLTWIQTSNTSFGRTVHGCFWELRVFFLRVLVCGVYIKALDCGNSPENQTGNPAIDQKEEGSHLGYVQKVKQETRQSSRRRKEGQSRGRVGFKIGGWESVRQVRHSSHSASNWQPQPPHILQCHSPKKRHNYTQQAIRNAPADARVVGGSDLRALWCGHDRSSVAKRLVLWPRTQKVWRC